MAHPFQPLASVGNSVSDAYFGALRQRAGAQNYACAHCKRDLQDATRLSDGTMVWCDASHRELWIRGKRDEQRRRELIALGWSEERWAAVQQRRTGK